MHLNNDSSWAFHVFQNVEVEEERVDDRSVDDLLSFINGGKGILGVWSVYFCVYFLFPSK